MNYRILGKTGYKVSEISLGTWQLGSKWGDPFDEKVARNTLEAAYEQGINLFDTADIYQDGMSENAVGEFVRSKSEKIYVVTKCGRKLNPHVAEGYNKDNITRFALDSLKNLGVESLDMLLLHCPPTTVYHSDEAFTTLDNLKSQGIVRNYGVSVERIDEAIAAMQYGISAIEASGLLTGKFNENSVFGENDHRNYNRDGKFFDKGETFSGIDYMTGVKAAKELKEALGTDNLAETALRYILMYPEVSTVIPGASSPQQIVNNANATQLPPFTPEQMAIVRDIYNRYIREQVHDKW